jgi:hypothetical protein
MSPTPAALAGVSPGTGAALVDGLVDELAGADDVVGSVHAHRARRRGAHAAAVGPLVVPVSRLEGVLDALDADPRSEPLDLVLVADSGLVEAAEARAVLLDDDRVALLGLHVALPLDGHPADSARLVLDTLDFALPAWVAVPLVPGWEGALDVLGEDGAERALLLTGHDPGDRALAEFVVGCARRGLAFSVAGGTWTASRVIALLAAAAAALDARDTGHVLSLIEDADDAQRLAVLADADAIAVRRLLVSVGTDHVVPALEGLESLGLLEPDGV